MPPLMLTPMDLSHCIKVEWGKYHGELYITRWKDKVYSRAIKLVRRENNKVKAFHGRNKSQVQTHL
jgi:hypothetical protein